MHPLRTTGIGVGTRLAALVMLSALPVFAIQMTHDIEARDTRKAEIDATAQTLAALVAARQDRVVEGARLLLIAASLLQPVREKNGPACNRRMADIAAEVPEATALAVVDAKGERWCVSLSGANPMNIADRDYFRATLKTGTMQSSNFIIGRQTGEGSIAFTYPLRDADDAIESIIFVAYRATVLSELLNDPPLPPGSWVALLGTDGIVAAAWPKPAAWIGKDLSQHLPIRQAVAGRTAGTTEEAAWLDGGDYKFGYAALKAPTNLTILVALPLEPALAEVEAHHWSQVYWTTLAFFLTALLAFSTARLMIVRPLNRLREAMDRFAAGKLSAPDGVGGSPELRAISDRFHALAVTLNERQAELEQAVRQKDLLLKEVNHRVKNSLQLVASLLTLQRSGIDDPEVRRRFDDAAQRINAVAHVHQRLYQDERFDRVSFDGFVRELCRELDSAMGTQGHIAIDIDAEACLLPTEQVIPLSLIVNELVTNAFKYAYPDGKGRITLSCRTEKDKVTVAVADNGKALPDGFDPSKSAGLGMRMIWALAHQLRADFKVVTRQAGKSFVIELPAPGAA